MPREITILCGNNELICGMGSDECGASALHFPFHLPLDSLLHTSRHYSFPNQHFSGIILDAITLCKAFMRYYRGTVQA